MTVTQQLAAVQERIAAACEAAGRDPAEVLLVAVSKGQPVEKIVEAYEAGQRVFGENYAQELAEKATALAALDELQWRFIGHLQRNKVRFVLGANARVDSVDSARLANAIARQHRSDEPALVLIQVNIADEPQKSGCRTADLAQLVRHVHTLPELTLRGLMGVPPHTDDPAEAAPYFQQLKALANEHSLQTTSMGMTHDLEVAIEEGATEVRIGTAIFGDRI